MNELKLPELEEVAEAYKRVFAPALLAQWSYRLADAAEVRQGQHALDVSDDAVEFQVPAHIVMATTS